MGQTKNESLVMRTEDEDEANHAFIGYNEWAKGQLQVAIATDFVYEYKRRADKDERGVYIAEDIKPHTQVFCIPFDSLFTVHALRDHAVWRSLPLFQDHDKQDEREDDQLALALLYEKFIARDQSKWSKHIALLPAFYHNGLTFTDAEMAALEGSNVHGIASAMKSKVQSDYARLEQSVLKDLFDRLGGRVSLADFEQFFSFENYKWALSTIWSRCVSLRLSAKELKERLGTDRELDDRDECSYKAMVPVFDMLNHDPVAEMSHFYDGPTHSFQLVSHQHWTAGAQLLINYGALSNHKLLALYGFVIPENPYDALEMWLPMDESSVQFYQEKTALLQNNGLDHQSTPFELTSDELNELLLIAARIQAIECASSEQLQELASKALDGDVISIENETAALTRLIAMLEHMLNQFKTTIEEDDFLLQKLPAEDDDGEQEDDSDHAQLSEAQRNERMAIVLRRSDKAILSENVRQLKWKLLAILPK